MLWHFDDVLQAAGVTYADWCSMVLAPLVSVALANGMSERERTELLYFARDRRLLARETDAEQDKTFNRLLADAAFRAVREAAFVKLLDGLPATVRQQVAFHVWDAAVAVARATFEDDARIDASEKEELTRLALLLGLGDTEDVRQVLGSSSRLLSYPRASSFALPQQESERTPADWATKWKTVSAAAWNDFNALVDSQEKAIADGKGRLDGVQSLAELSFPEKTYVDAGVVVLPRNLADREVYLVGDLHGDYESLQAALQVTGLESSSSRPLLVFLGDYGDRGEDTLAIWLRLAQIKARFPDDVVLLRGNHEDLIKVQSIRASNGKALSRPWYVPATTNNDTYVALGFALESNLANMSALFESLPAMALFPDGMLAIHGGPVPRWKEGDGWKLPDDEKNSLRVGMLADLRKPRAQFVMRWVDILDRNDVDLAWAEYGGGSRLSAAALDLAEWRNLLGIQRLVHGHTHPQSGFEWACDENALAVNTSLATGQRACIARWKPNSLEPIPLKNA